MGYFLKAHCPSCGFTAGVVQFGHGMMHREPLIPAWDSTTEMLIAVGKNDPREIKRYDEPSMYRNPDRENLIQSVDSTISRTANWCPGCGEMEMEFEEVGEWD